MDGGISASVAGATEREARPAATADVAWLAAVPCTVALIVLLGEPLGALLEPAHRPRVWPYSYFTPSPEPVEQARFLLALLGPLLAAGGVLLGARRPLRTPALLTVSFSHASQALLLAFLVTCLVAQRAIDYSTFGGAPTRAYFTPRTLVVAGALGIALVLVLHARRACDLIARWARETPRRRLAYGGVAVLMTSIWLLTAVQLDASSGNANGGVTVNLPWWLGETYGVLDGRTPLVDFNPQYSHLWPYVTAAALSLFGTSLGVYTVTMAAISGVALVAVYAILRRVAGSSLLALGLYLPVLATGFFMEIGPPENRYGPSNLFSIFPMRYAGPYLLAWVVARHLAGTRPRHLWLVFLAAGVVVLNNFEFGIPAIGATVAALLWTQSTLSWASLRKLCAALAIGVGGAVGLLSLLTLVRAGSLPDLGMLTFFSRLYGVTGFAMLPMPGLGFHLALYATFAAAIVVATVRAVERRPEPVLTGMLAWTGVFGLGIGSYFAGRSHPEVLIDLFSAWALAMALLLVVAVRAIQARASRLPTFAEIALIGGVGLSACSLAQTPTPWSQIERLADDGPPPFYLRHELERFVARHTVPGEPVAILTMPGHWIAYEAGVVNVAPYVSWYAMPLVSQLGKTLDALLASGGTKLFDSSSPGESPVDTFLRRRGFRVGAVGRGAIEYVYRGPGAERRR